MAGHAIPPRASFDVPDARLTRLLMENRVRQGWNALLITRRRNPARLLMTIIIGLPLLAGLIGLLAFGFSEALVDLADPRASQAAVASLLAAASIAAFLGASTSALQAFYLADDMPFLLTLPVPLRLLFSGKVIDVGTGTIPSILLVAAALFGYAIAQDGSPVTYFVAVAAAMSLLTITIAAAIALASFVTKSVPPRRTRLFLLGIAGAMMTIALLIWKIAGPGSASMTNADESRLARLYSLLVWTPAGWTVEATRAASNDQPLLVIGYVGLLTGTALIALSLSFRVFSRTFIHGLMKTQAFSQEGTATGMSRLVIRSERYLPSAIAPLVVKEWLVMSRDLKRLSGAIWPVGILLAYTFAMTRRAGGAGDGVEFFTNNGTLALMPWGISLGLSLYAFGSEGRALNLLRSLPIAPRTIFTAKVFASAIPVIALSFMALLVTLIIRDASPEQFAVMGALTVWAGFGFVTIDVMASATAPRPDATQIQRSIALHGRALSILLDGLFAILTAAAMLATLRVVYPPANSEAQIGWPVAVVCWLVAAAVPAGSALLGLRQTSKLMQLPD